MKKKNRKNIIKFIIIFAISFIAIWLVIEMYREFKIQNKESINEPYNVQNIGSTVSNEQKQDNSTETKETEQKAEEQHPKEEVITNYKGYLVAAKLEIPKIELETYILQKYSTEALKVSVTKFWGADPNEVGNFCVAGHNFINKNMFRNLKQLQNGDTFTISDNTVGKIEYEIYNIYTTQPDDVSCLSQQTNGKKEVTLITCTNDSKKRIIVKAHERN